MSPKMLTYFPEGEEKTVNRGNLSVQLYNLYLVNNFLVYAAKTNDTSNEFKK